MDNENTGRDVELIQVIRTYLRTRGKGTEKDPIRTIAQYWSLKGELLAENDPCDEIPTRD